MQKEDFLRLGYKIKFERGKQKISQLELALKTGLTTRTVSRIECGTIDPKLSTLTRIADALGIKITDLLNLDRKSVV